MQITISILISVGIMSIIGIAIGSVLAYASKKFEVKGDPLAEAVAKVLPGVNCGGCGYPGCKPYAEAVATGQVSITLCTAGGQKVADDIAGIMGKEKPEAHEKKTARVMCAGEVSATRKKYEAKTYIKSCSASNLYFAGDKTCMYGCLGYGDCVKVCPFDAIEINEKGIAKVNEDKCTSCGKCVSACPKHIIDIVPQKSNFTVLCSSHDKGQDARKACSVPCIACGICAKNCPVNAIKVENFLAVIDPNVCTNCGICETKCPTKAIKKGI